MNDNEKSQTTDTSSDLFGAICWIGEVVILNGHEVVVMDTNFLCRAAKVGVPDTNGIVWDAIWVSWDFLCKPNYK